MSELRFEISIELLTATIEALRDLKAYYESDACALARLGGQKAKTLARQRLEQAETANELFEFYLHL